MTLRIIKPDLTNANSPDLVPMGFADRHTWNVLPCSGQGFFVTVGYVQDAGTSDRFENLETASLLSKFAGKSIARLKKMADHAIQRGIGFNDEKTLLNSRFYIAVGFPYQAPEFISIEDALYELFRILTEINTEVCKPLPIPFRLALGVSYGNLTAAKVHDREIRIFGDSCQKSLQLTYAAEEINLASRGHQIYFDQNAYDQLGAQNQLKYARSISPLPTYIDISKEPLYCGVI